MSSGRALAQHRVRPFWHILDLNTWHGAIMALSPPKCNRPLIGRRGRSDGSTSRQEGPGPGHRPQATPDHHRRLGARRAVAALVSPGHSGPAARAQSCLTRAGHRPVAWPHEIPDSGISHRNAGSGPRSGTEAGDISPVFAALEHAAGDFTTLGKNPLLEYSIGHVKWLCREFCDPVTQGAR